MSQIQEIHLQAPDLAHDRFYVERRGKEFQKWEQLIYNHDELEFYLESEEVWLRGTIASWYIDDASGNAPGANAHFFLVIRRDGKTYKYDLHEDLLLKMEIPTDEELIARSGWCEGGDEVDRGPYMSPDYEHCMERGIRYIAASGQHCWYCARHIPTWLTAQKVS